MNRSRCSAVGGPMATVRVDVGGAVEILRAGVDEVEHSRARGAGPCARSCAVVHDRRRSGPRPRSWESSRRGRATPPPGTRPGARRRSTSVMRPVGASRASHAKKRVSATPSFSWALWAPASSTSFFDGLGERGTDRRREPPSRRAPVEALDDPGRGGARLRPGPSDAPLPGGRARGRARRAGGRARPRRGAPGGPARAWRDPTKRSTVRRDAPPRTRVAPARGRRRCRGRSESHATESGAARTTASTPSRAEELADLAPLVGDGRAGMLQVVGDDRAARAAAAGRPRSDRRGSRPREPAWPPPWRTRPGGAPRSRSVWSHGS